MNIPMPYMPRGGYRTLGCPGIPPPRVPEPLQWPVPLLLEKFAEYRDQLVREVAALVHVDGVVTSVNGKTGEVTLGKADIGLDAVVNTGDSAIPTEGGLTKFTTGGAFTELAKKVSRSDLFDNPDTNPTVKSALLPSYVDDVLEYASLAAFPATGETGKIYVAKDTNKTYRWPENGSAYVEIAKSVEIVPPSTDSAAAGKPADAKSTGDALALRPTKAQLDAGWWSEWTILRDDVDVTSRVRQPVWEPDEDKYADEIWDVDALPSDGEHGAGMIDSGVGRDATALHWGSESGAHYTATRHRVAAPVPTKPEDIGAQPAGSYATAAQGAKADAALSRAEAEAGFTEWKFSDGNTHTVIGPVETPHDGWIYGLDSAYSSVQYFSTKAEADAALDLEFAIVSVTATRIRLPTMADIPTKTSDLTNDSGFLTQHQQLTPVYSQTPTFSEWVVSPPSTGVFWTGDKWWFDGSGPADDPEASNPDATTIRNTHYNITATRTRTDVIGYTLGDQTTKPLQPQGDYAPATNIPKTALASDVQTSLGKADTALQTAPVTSVNSKTGAVVLNASDVGAATRAPNPIAGNLAALDANGNPTDSGVKASDKLDSTSAAPAFSSDSSVSYPVGSHCTYNGKLYVCTTATTGGTWDASKWTADTMTNPDAVLDITSQNQLRVVAKDGTLLWAQGYDLTSTSSATLACDTANNFTFADGATTQAFTLPAAPTGKVGDFGLDIDNFANTSAATLTLTGLDSAFSIVVPKGESLNDMLSIAAGELARFYISLSTFRVNNLPTWHIVKQIVENGGATV